jgi:hypothetical protein
MFRTAVGIAWWMRAVSAEPTEEREGPPQVIVALLDVYYTLERVKHEKAQKSAYWVQRALGALGVEV